MTARTPQKDYAITLIGFRRANHIHDTLRALTLNHGIDGTPLYIFIDGPRKHNSATARDAERARVREVVQLCESFEWNGKKIIHAAKTNKGLQANVRYAIDTTLCDYGGAIIVEDDIITSPYFYDFLSCGLKRFADDSRVGAICGHCYPYAHAVFNPNAPYFLRHFACWGWATWRRAWDAVCWDTAVLRKTLRRSGTKKTLDFGNSRWVSGILDAQHNRCINTWDVQTGVSFFINNQMCLYPPETLTNNSGWRMDGLSTHTSGSINPNAPLAYTRFTIPEDITVEENPRARKACSKLVCPPRVRIKNYVRAVVQPIKLLIKKYLRI